MWTRESSPHIHKMYCFHTKDRDDRRITQNSGIFVSREHDGKEVDFYGVLSNVVVLNYILGYKVILLKCSWYDTNQKKLNK